HHKIFLHTPDGGCGVVAGDDDPGAGQVAATGVFGVAGYGIGAVGAGYGIGAVGAGITQLCRVGGDIGIAWCAGFHRRAIVGARIVAAGAGAAGIARAFATIIARRVTGTVIGILRAGARCLGVIRSRRQ